MANAMDKKARTHIEFIGRVRARRYAHIRHEVPQLRWGAFDMIAARKRFFYTQGDRTPGQASIEAMGRTPGQARRAIRTPGQASIEAII